MARKLHAEIAGAGFAGLTAAISLARQGWSVRVHEASPELREFGAGIFIWDNGLRILKALGAYDAVMASSHEAPGYEMRDAQDQRVSLIHFGAPKRTKMVTMTRQRLYSALLAVAQKENVDFITDSKVVAAAAEGTLTTANDKTYKADLIVGADGVRSAVRQSLAIDDQVISYETGVTRLLVHREPDDLQHGNSDNVINFWNKKLRVLYVPCNADELYIALGAPRADKDHTAIPVNKDLWSEAFPHLAHIIARIGSQARYDTYEMRRLEHWHRGRVAVVGDAAHPMPPTLGQGAGCAMMNAWSLGRAMGNGGEVGLNLKTWELEERGLTDHTQRLSAEYARTSAGSEGDDKFTAEALKAAWHVPAGTAAAL